MSPSPLSVPFPLPPVFSSSLPFLPPSRTPPPCPIRVISCLRDWNVVARIVGEERMELTSGHPHPTGLAAPLQLLCYAPSWWFLLPVLLYCRHHSPPTRACFVFRRCIFPRLVSTRRRIASPAKSTPIPKGKLACSLRSSNSSACVVT